MSANLTANFTPGVLGNRVALPHTVSVRSSWADEWTEVPHLYCDWASWAVAPGMSSAQLSWQYGRVWKRGSVAAEIVLPDDGARRYVRVEWSNVVNAIGGSITNPVWYGIILGAGTRQGGLRTFTGTTWETGQQKIQCVGLEKLLDETIVRTGVWWDHNEGQLYRTDRGLTFNALRADGTPGGNRGNYIEGVPVFSGLVLDDDSFWTTPECLSYLVGHHGPRDKTNAEIIPFRLQNTEMFINNDRPHVPTHGRNLRELFNQLIPAERLFTWRVDLVEDVLLLKVISLADDVVPLPGGTADMVFPNPRRWLINFDASPGDMSRVLSHAQAIDRVRIHGARATSTFSLSFEDGTLEKGWTTANEFDYEQGASTTAGYAALNKAQKQVRNAEARGRDKFSEVYSRFSVRNDWDGVAGDGEGNLGHDFCPHVTDTPAFRFYQREFFLEKMTPLRDGYDYTALGGSANPVAPTKISSGPHNQLPPLVAFQVPDQTKWMQAEKIGLASTFVRTPNDPLRNWSARVTIPRMDRAIVVQVSGSHQHVIAGPDFGGQGSTIEDVHPSRPEGNWSWRKMIATVSAQWDAFCEGVWPPQVGLPDTDNIREVVLQAAETFRLDWIVPQTVVGITVDGALVRSTAGGWINDDRDKLTDRARMAFEFYGRERRAISWSSYALNGSIQPGDFVSTLGVAIPYEVNTVITEVRIDQPPGSLGSDPPIPMISYTTDYIRDLDLYLSPPLSDAELASTRFAREHRGDDMREGFRIRKGKG